MKKIIVGITTLIISCVALFSGCSCTELSQLNFNDDWNKNTAIGYTETSVYDVSLDKEYKLDNFNYAQDVALKNAGIDYGYTGTYTVTATTLAGTSVQPEQVGNSDLIGGENGIQNVIHLHTELKLNASYKYGDLTQPELHNDTIVTDCYFSDTKTSLAPIYSTTVSDVSYLAFTGSAYTFRAKITSTTVYNKQNYTFKSTTQTEDVEPYTNEQTYEYSPRTVIDNNELLFAMRNFPIAPDAVQGINVASISYEGDNITLAVKNFSQYVREQQGLTINGQTVVNNKIPVDVYGFNVNSDNSGLTQLMFIQRDTSQETELDKTGHLTDYKSLMVEYVTPLLTQGSGANHYRQGALVYKLKSVNWSN